MAHKTRRGLEGRVRQGKSGGGLCFGYDVVRKLDASGEASHGERRINEGEAAIVRRIFEEFAKGRSPRASAQSLNKDGIAGPGGRSWGPSTIYGNWRRATGLLNNEHALRRNRLRSSPRPVRRSTSPRHQLPVRLYRTTVKTIELGAITSATGQRTAMATNVRYVLSKGGELDRR